MKPLPLAVLLSFSFAVEAHHSPASFDQSTEVVVEGTVTEIHWTNPHAYLALETKGPGGDRVVQQVETSPNSALTTWGVTRESLRVGDRVRVRAHPNRRGAGYVVLGLELTIDGGSVLPLHARTARSSSTSAAATSIFGTWVVQPEGLPALARAMSVWPATQRAREIMASGGADVAAANSECIPAGVPGLMVYPNTIVVAAENDTVTFEIDWMGARRTVRLDAQHPSSLERTRFGDSVGRWDGGALVVDTVGFTTQAAGMGLAFPSSDAKHVVERFSLSDDRTHLEYEAVVEDSVYLAESVTVTTRWDYRPRQAMSDEPCDPAVARRFLSE